MQQVQQKPGISVPKVRLQPLALICVCEEREERGNDYSVENIIELEKGG
jgi:hypothetical protein